MMVTYTNPKTNESIETELPFDRVIELLKDVDNSFARSLYSQAIDRGLSGPQQYWAVKLVSEKIKEPQPVLLASDLQAFCSRGTLIQFKLPEYGKIQLRTMPKCINVYCGTYYYGNIIGDKYYSSRYAKDGVTAELLLLSLDPITVLAQYGKDSGVCCFCRRELTDERSVNVGYGPICAEYYGLPWG